MSVPVTDKKRFYFDNPFFTNPKPCGDSLIYQLGEAYLESAAESAPHKQVCYEFTYVLDGKGVIYTDGAPCAVKKHDCYWSCPNETHRIVSDAVSPLRYAYVAYTSEDADIATVHRILLRKNAPQQKTAFNSPSLQTDFLQILTEIATERSFSSSMLDVLLKTVVIKYFRLSTHAENTVYKLDKKNPSYIAYQTASFIDRNLLKMTDLSELEKTLHYNYQYLSRNFNKCMGMNLNKYLTAKKMEKAAHLLTDGEGVSVTRAAELLNYSCIHVFSRAFKNFFGVSPLEYAAENKGKNTEKTDIKTDMRTAINAER